MAIEPATPTYLKWSKTPISLSRADTWTIFSNPERYPLVLDPTVAGVKLSKVLVDGGSGLNVIFVDTLRKMGGDLLNQIQPSDAPFYGIVPGNAAQPLGQITLLVMFGIRTQPTWDIGQSPFYLVYGSEAVLSVDLYGKHQVWSTILRTKPKKTG